MKKVSIIVPFFNGLMYAKDCLDSIMDQGLAFEEYEVICLGDAPEEGIVTIIENYENLGMPVRYVQWFENKGTYFARNKGLDMAEGEYVYFMDNDDYLMPGCIGRLVECAKADDALVVRGDIVSTDKERDSFSLKDADTNLITEDKKGNDALLSVFFENEITVLNLLIKREHLEHNNIRFSEDIKFFGDMEFVMKLFCSVDSYYVAHDAVLCKRKRAENGSSPSLLQMYAGEEQQYISDLVTEYGRARVYPVNQPKRLNSINRILCDAVLKVLDDNISIDDKELLIRCSIYVRNAIKDVPYYYTNFERAALVMVGRRQYMAAGFFVSLAHRDRNRIDIKKTIKRTAKKIAETFYNIVNNVMPLSKRTIVFSSALGRSFAGNPKAIYEKIVELGLDKKYNCVWFYDQTPLNISGRHKSVRYKGLRYLYYMARAGVWVFDARQPSFLRKRSGVLYLQTWHGTPLKKLGLDLDNIFMSGETSVSEYKREFARNASTWDLLISQNSFSTEIFRRAFDFKHEILETGYPRNDKLINCNDEDSISQIKRKLGLPPDKKVILYAPTWRDDDSNSPGHYNFTTALDINAMKKAFSDDAVLVVKYHYLVSDKTDWSVYGGFVRSFDESKDISDIYLVSDILITDYSSVMFDYSLLKRPMYFYCYDLERYKNILRGFYFDFENEAPGPISLTTTDLINDIKGHRHEEYKDKYDAFTKKYNPWDDGCASQKVVEYIDEKVNRL